MSRSAKWDAFRSIRRDATSATFASSSNWWRINFLKLIILIWAHVSLILGVVVTKSLLLLISTNLQPGLSPCEAAKRDEKATVVHLGLALLVVQLVPDIFSAIQGIWGLSMAQNHRSDLNLTFVFLETWRAAGLAIFFYFVSPALDPYRAIIFVSLPVLLVPTLTSAWRKMDSAIQGASMNKRLRRLASSVPPYYAALTALSSVTVWITIDTSFIHLIAFPLVLLLLSDGTWEYWIDDSPNNPIFKSLYKRSITYRDAVLVLVESMNGASPGLKNVVLLGFAITIANVFMRTSTRFLASMGLTIMPVLNPFLVAPPIIGMVFAGVCRFASPCHLRSALAYFSLEWTCSKWSETLFKHRDDHFILLYFVVYVLWASVHLLKRQGPARKKSENIIDSMSPLISPFSIETSTEVYHYRLKDTVTSILEDDQRCVDDDEDVDKRDFFDEKTLYICATMWHETKNEMAQMIKSILRLDEEQDKRHTYRERDDDVNFRLEAHIFFDDAWEDLAECGRVPNAYFKQLFELLIELTIMDEDVVEAACQRILVTTPYGGRLVMQLPAGTLLCVHLKDKKLMRHKKRWSQVMYMYYLLGHRIMDTHLTIEDRQHIADNTFIMAIDGDSKFEPQSVIRLLSLMKTKPDIGCACGRIHPIGNGIMVWYQKFEYAIGHWFQKASEHVFGCVLCAPGCFSLFRASAIMDDNIMHKYTKTATDPHHFVQYDQGEDRWLSTLLLKQGYRIEYDAAADAETYAPEGFEEFFNQRRRWTPSSVANTFDLLADYKKACENNESISKLYILYQMLVIGFSLLGPAIIFSMLVFAQVAAFGANATFIMIINSIPVTLFTVCCFMMESRWQLLYAKIVSIVYAFIMLAVLVATSSQIVRETAVSPTSIFVLAMIGIFFVAALLHPREFYNIIFGPIFFLMIPSTYVFLSLYSLINLNVINWGTREAVAKATGTGQQEGKAVWKVQSEEDEQKEVKYETLYENPNQWMDCEYLESCDRGKLKPSEERFWDELIETYLKPIKTTPEAELEHAKGLVDLRNKVSFAIILTNGLLVLAIFLLQKHKDVLSIHWLPYEGFQWTKMNELTGQYENTGEALLVDPLGMGIVVFLLGILIVQTIGLLIHRLNTLVRALHEAAKVENIFTSKNDANINYEEIMAQVRAMIDCESYEREAHGSRGYKRTTSNSTKAPSKVSNVLYKLEREYLVEPEDSTLNEL